MMTSPSTAMTSCLPAPPLLQIRCTVSSTSIVKTTIHFSRIYPSCCEEICCQCIELEQWRRDELRCYDPAPIFHFPPPPPSLSHYAIPTNLPKSFLLCHPHQSLSQHVHNEHQFNASPLPAFPCHPHRRLWIYVHPVHLAPPSLMSYPSQMSLTSRTLTCRHCLVPPKPSTFGKPSTAPRSMPLRPEIEPHHHCQWKQSQPASHNIVKHATPLPCPSHLPHATTVHHQKHLVHAATLRILMTTARTPPTCSTNTITGKHTVSISCKHPRIGPL